MAMLISSPSALTVAGTPDVALIDAIKCISKGGHIVHFLSNHDVPAWFSTFQGVNLGFTKELGRQNGNMVKELAALYGQPSSEVVVLGTSDADMRMAKNAGAVFLSGAWGGDDVVKKVGLPVDSAATLEEVVSIMDKWNGAWWFQADEPKYKVRVVADLSSYYVAEEQVDFAKKLTATAKQGGSGLIPVAAISARSLLHDQVNAIDAQFWGLYPSSSKGHKDTEVLSGFTHGLRTMLGRAQHAKRNDPLFVRHTDSTKRSKAGKSVDREDPTEQIQTVHLNPAYKASIQGKNVFLIDDCTTHGVSFGVAASFLQAAGARTVTCVAIGKFGNQLKYYDIELASSPFAPVKSFKVKEKRAMKGQQNAVALQDLKILLP